MGAEDALKTHRVSLVKCVLRLVAILPFALFAAVPTLAQTPPPVIVSSVGYINGTALTAHTSTSFNSTGASTLVAFVSTNTPWNGLPVGITHLSDNLGNTWNLLTGPTVFSGSSFTLQSAVYYVNGPVTGATQAVTVQLTNPAPLVFHVFAVSGSDVTGPPISSAITDPGSGGTSATVTTAPITVPTNSLLLSWVKNETSATATALNGFTLDAQSTSYLWAESESPNSAGSYTGDFQYNSTIGWQTAIVGLQPSLGPVAFSQAVTTSQGTPVGITLTATSRQGFPLTYTVLSGPTQGTLSGSAPNLTYTPNAGYVGPDAFTFSANDGTTNSNTATVSIAVRGQAPFTVSSVGYINPTPLTAHTSTAFNSTGASTLVAFVSSHPSWNGQPVSISGLSDNLGNTWNLMTGPTTWSGSSYTLVSAIYYVNSPATSITHTVTVQLTNPAPLVFHVFAVSGSDVTGPPISSAITDPGSGGTSATVTTAPITVPTNSLLLSWVKNETSATATALNGFTLDAQSTSYLWAESESPNSAGSYTGDFQYNSTIGWQTAIVGVKPYIPVPVITSTPSNPTNETSANFSFTDTEAGVSFFCQLDGSAFSACSSPATYFGLSLGNHTFSVKAQDAAGNQSAAATFSWTIGVMPTVSSVSPNNGPAAGGTGVTITGTNFATGATVTFGGTAATNVVVVSGTQITATTPAGSAGAVTVTVTVNGQGGSLSNGFTYLIPPTVSSVSPNSGATTGGTAVTIAGTNFATGATVTFGSAAATNVVVMSGTQITATTPAGSVGAVTVTVTVGGQNGSLTNGFTYVVVPTVSSVSPNNGPAAGGTAVTITGTNFAAGATVTFGGTAATNVVVVSGTQITATTPAGSAGAVTVTVTVNGQSGSLSNGFTYLIPPTVSSVSPNSGATTGGTAVTIAGTNFAAGATVTFGSAAATNVVVMSGTQITATTPAGSAGAVTVTVTNPGAQSGSLANGFAYVVVPTVSSVSPNNGPAAGGTAVTITGTNFAAGATVTFGGTAATNVVVVSGTQITATTPAHAAGAVTVTVTVNGQSGSLSNGFTYNPAVAIGFAQVAAATPQSPTATVSVTYPAAQTAGDMNVVVVGWNDTTSTVQSVKDSGGNTYSLAIGPTTGTALRQSIYYLSNIAGGNKTVTVTFNQPAAYPDVRILEYRGATALDVTAGASGSGTAASSGSATTTSASELIFGANTVATSTGAAGSGFTSRIITSPDGDIAEDKVVTTVGSNSATAALSSSGPWVMQMVTFSAVSGPVPTVSSVAPNNGPAAGGTSVTITGTNLAAGATVAFGGVAVTNVVVVSGTQITATTPAGSAGAVTVTVTNPGGQSGSLASAFTYIASPTVSSVSPNNGPAAGGTGVTITGTNFATGATVTFGGTAATNVVVVSGTQITATTPAGSAGAVTVTVTNSNGQSGRLASGFTYLIPPTVSSVSPNSGATTGGTAVTIAGTNFATGATVTFGSAAATNVVVMSGTQITATTPAGSVGAVTVTVTVGGQNGSLTNGFTYVVVPTVSSVSPNNGPAAGGTAVTITGTNFAAGATVTFGGTAATNVVVVSGTQITATTPAGSAGAVTVTVTVNGQSGSLSNGFTYLIPPTVSSVSPNSGATTGGTAVTIAGTNFAAGATVTFGSAAATNVVVMSGTQITATTPAGSAGAVTVTVTNPGAQSGSLANGFAYVVVPTVSSVSPNNGPAAGGTAVTITGTNFAAGATVTFGGTAATNVVVVSGTQITATTPAHAAGAVTVTVTVNGQSGSLSNGFTYNPAVAIGFAQVAAATPQSPTATVSVTYPAAQTAGDMNVVVVGWNDTTSTVQSVKDSGGNTYSLAIGPTTGTALRQSIYYLSNIAGGNKTVTVTFNQPAAYPDVRILEYRGATALDVTAGASGSGTAASSGSATTTSASELIFGANTVATSTGAAGSGFTSRIITSPDGDIAEDKVVTTVGSNSATAALSSSGPWVMQMVTFK